MKKRSIVLGAYDTASHGWTLTGWQLSDPEQKTNYVDKSGGDGSWDLSTTLTDGIPRYKDRNLTITLECSEGTRADREELINYMINFLDGFEWQIVLPDHPNYYLMGRLHIAVNQNSLSYAAITITSVVKPWFFATRETVVTVHATDQTETLYLINDGRRVVVPVLTASDNIKLTYGNNSVNLTQGSFEWAALMLTPGTHELKYNGTGELKIVYRKAVLR